MKCREQILVTLNDFPSIRKQVTVLNRPEGLAENVGRQREKDFASGGHIYCVQTQIWYWWHDADACEQVAIAFDYVPACGNEVAGADDVCGSRKVGGGYWL